jgi:hypothetical protein
METHSAEYHRLWYHQQSPEWKTKKIQAQNDRKGKILQWIRDFKSSRGCSECPERDWRCLDFHHLGNKSFNVGMFARNGWSIETLQSEIEKCVILCSNCHRKKTFEERQSLILST